MVVFLNGRFLPGEAAHISILDRGFLLGDGLFETLLIVAGRPHAWEAHLDRLARGAAFLNIRPPLTALEMRRAIGQLIVSNGLPDCVLRLTLTRGPGPRGYSPGGADAPTLLMALHPLPGTGRRGLRLVTSSFRVAAADPLTQFKTCGRLVHVLARAEAEAQGAEDALLLNERGQLAEATSSNVFWFAGDVLSTPPAGSGAMPGVTRGIVLGLAKQLGIRCREIDADPSVLGKAAGVFLTNSVEGIVEAAKWDGAPLRRSPFTARLKRAYAGQLRGS